MTTLICTFSSLYFFVKLRNFLYIQRNLSSLCFSLKILELQVYKVQILLLSLLNCGPLLCFQMLYNNMLMILLLRMWVGRMMIIYCWEMKLLLLIVWQYIMCSFLMIQIVLINATVCHYFWLYIWYNVLTLLCFCEIWYVIEIACYSLLTG